MPFKHRKHPRPWLDELERRLTPANVTTYHNDLASTGVNPAETLLTRSNVHWTGFGKQFATPVDGQVYAQPLVVRNVNITTGPYAGVRDVVFVATQHDSLYAIDANDPGTGTGKILWQRSFLNAIHPGAIATPVPQPELQSGDITVEVGITGTPVIDAAAGKLYLIPKTKEVVSGQNHYIQRMFCVNLSDGSNATPPVLISDTIRNGNEFTISSPVFVYGNGVDKSPDTYYGTGKSVVQFNALRQNQRSALTLLNGTVYAGWSSHGGSGPYHGWVVGFDPLDLHFKSVLCTTPNGNLGGIWMAGGALSADPQGNMYLQTGNGTFSPTNGARSDIYPTEPAPGPVTGLDANGFPLDANYGDSFLKISVDPSTTPANQNSNGWGLKIVDYFTPYNEEYLDIRDMDLGSGAPLILPAEAGSAANPNLVVGSGKEGVIYLLNRDNLGKFGQSDNVVQKFAGQLSGSLCTPAYFKNVLYYVEGYGGNAKTFSISNGVMSTTPTSKSLDSFAFAGSTPSISANGKNDGIVWDVDRGTNQLRAYSSDSYATELYHTAQAANNRDALGQAVKFQVPTVANGHVYVAAGAGAPDNFLVVYGLIQPPSAVPAAPTSLTATPVSGSQINLAWVRNELSPNLADGYYVEQSPNGSTSWAQIAAAGAGATGYAVGGLSATTAYHFRVRAFNTIGASVFSNTANATTTTAVTIVNYSAGFSVANTSGVLTFNGGPSVAGSRLRITGGPNEGHSIFTTSKVVVSRFTTTFDFQINPAEFSADGFTFCIQGESPTALGSGGGGLGYGTDGNGFGSRIGQSLAVKFDLYPNATEGFNSTGLYLNGADPIFPYFDVTPNINLHIGHVIRATFDYDGSTLTQTLVDLSTSLSFTKTYTGINIASLVGGGSAYVGFTGGTGGLSAIQEVLAWTFTPITPPGVPSNLNAAVTGYVAGSTSPVPIGAQLNWAASSGATSYKIERRLLGSPTFAQIGTSGIPSFNDTGLATQSSYVYRVRGTNAAGDGAYSPEATITTPALAPTPTGGVATATTTTSISVQWTDHANNEDGYQVFRSTNAGGFMLVTSLPAVTTAAPSTATWTDTGLTPGATYDYHIQAFNLSGYSDYAGISTATRTLPPTNLGAMPGPGLAVLTWTASSGATSYTVARGTSIIGPFDNIATAVVGTTFTDFAATFGQTYWYVVSAVTLGGTSNSSSSATATPEPLPAVMNFDIDDGSDQRSRIRSLTVTFNRVVNLGSSPFNLIGPGGAVPLSWDTLSSTPTQTIARITFGGTSLEAGSLHDGQYQFTVLGSAVSSGGQPLDGDGNNSPGGNYAENFHRLFGDKDGTGHVDLTDFGAFRTAFFGSSFIFDWDDSGQVDLADFAAFRLRFGM